MGQENVDEKKGFTIKSDLVPFSYPLREIGRLFTLDRRFTQAVLRL